MHRERLVVHEALGAAGTVNVSAGGRLRLRHLRVQVDASVTPAPLRTATVTPAPPCSW